MNHTLDFIRDLETRLFKLIDKEHEIKLNGRFNSDSVAGMNNLSKQISDLIITYSRAVATC